MNRYSHYNSDLDAFELYHIESEELERLNSTAEPRVNPRPPPEYNAVIAGLSGAVGTSIASIAVYPLDLIVKRLQVQRAVRSESPSGQPSRDESYNGFIDAASKIYHEEGGLGAFYTGCLQDTANSMVSAFIYFLSYNFMRQRRLQAQARDPTSPSRTPNTLGVLEELSIGVLAGATAKLFTAPVANVVTRKQTAALHQPDAKPGHRDTTSATSVAAIVKDIYTERGLRGFWSGYDATLILTLNPAITFLLYETSKSLLPRRYRDRPTGGQTFVLAAVAKAVASAVMYPISMAKTRSQVRRNNSSSGQSTVYATLLGAYAARGLAGMYEGIWGEVLKGFFSNGNVPLVE
ncbi:hypothetical protein DRE_03732 [Drechslerella stenobrocha 248]|uniref:Mitochondrial carrier n=1 Tax=Drechslerella stenobrocha 248 TaxID=1043628 RepID=W7IDB9_9PEZI|nr:hypothetical protein DRE_03732 [Drechslerella stenobrocha 248]